MERYIQVLGVGIVYAKPDTFVVNLTIIARNTQYDKVIQEINQMSDELIAIISGLVSKEKIEVYSYYVDTDYQQKENNGVLELVPVGYIARESFRVQIPTDLVLLQDVMNAAIYSKAHPEMQVTHTLSNKDTYINKAIVNAINDAYEKSALISNTVGVKIQSLKNIEYKDRANIEPFGHQYTQLSTVTGNIRDISLEPVVIEERVLITYSI